MLSIEENNQGKKATANPKPREKKKIFKLYVFIYFESYFYFLTNC